MRPSEEPSPKLRSQLLIAHPALREPAFRKSVLFLPIHDHEGAYGLILNRPTEHHLPDLLADSAPPPLAQIRVYEGGPVGVDQLTLVLFRENEQNEVIFAQLSLEQAEMALAAGGGILRAYRGYSGWSPGQLESELQQNTWILQPATLESVVQTSGEHGWRNIVAALGPAYRLLAMAPDDPSLN